MKHEDVLKNAGVRVTALRLMIWRTISDKMKEAFSLADLEQLLISVDKSTLFRSLILFTEHGLLHTINDGSGSHKYCVCHCDDHNHHHGHVHLTCIHCHKTWCLENVSIPSVSVPTGYDVVECEYIVKTVCPMCKNKK